MANVPNQLYALGVCLATRTRVISDLTIDDLHLTSWRPCWKYNTKEYVISSIVGSTQRGWLTLSAMSREIDCKPRKWYTRSYYRKESAAVRSTPSLY